MILILVKKANCPKILKNWIFGLLKIKAKRILISSKLQNRDIKKMFLYLNLISYNNLFTWLLF